MPQILFFQNPSPHDLKSKVSVFQNVMRFHHFFKLLFLMAKTLSLKKQLLSYICHISGVIIILLLKRDQDNTLHWFNYDQKQNAGGNSHK